jgi:cytochrome c2
MTPPTPPTPPKASPTPPEKRPDRHYNFGRMNMVFAVSSLLLLAVTLWMVFADYAQPWKRYQAEFRALERQKLAKDTEGERKKINEQQVAQLKKDVQAAQTDLEKHNRGARELEQRIDRLKAEIYTADAAWKKAKGDLDASRFEYDTALQAKAGDAAEKGREVERNKKALEKAKQTREDLEAKRDAAQAELAEKKKAITEAEKKLDDLQSGLSSVEKRAAALGKGIDYLILNAPLMDFLQPSLHVQQVVLPGLYHNMNFTTVSRVDRCMTCHVAANRPGFDGPEWKEPFRTHPKLDVYVGDGSPHPFTKFGCTACHGGLDRATDFSRAGHSPKDAAQERDWLRRLHWERQRYLENPILPSGMSEAGCVTCHAADVWTPKATTQETGRFLLSHMGCGSCHLIDLPAYKDLRKPGPDLTRIAEKTNPGWAYKWIAAPRDFHPTTFMPHFFFQENIKGEANRRRQETEITAIVSYLWANSEKTPYPETIPAGDAKNGEKLFNSVGCAGCHIREDGVTRTQVLPTMNRLHGPNLIRTGSKVSPGWLYAWVKNPKQYWPETAMPSLRLTDPEAADLTAYLLSSRDPRYENVTPPAPDPKLRDELVLGYLQANLTIEGSQKKLATMPEAERNVYLGNQTILKYGCYSCHNIKGYDNVKPIGTELTAEGSKPLHQLDFGHVEIPETRHDWIHEKLLRPRIFDQGKESVKDYNDLLKMPNFGMSEEEAQAVLTNVVGFTKESVELSHKAGIEPRTAALAAGRRLISNFNCQGCHLIEGNGHAIKAVISEPSLLPPNLAAEGARVQSGWLFDYVHDPSRVKMRPWLTVRMPTFGFTDEQANTVLAYFGAREERQPFLSPFPGADPKSLAVGKVVFNLFQCAKCHPAGAEAAKATGMTPDLAPSLLLAHDRLRYDWVPSWIKDPQKWVPGTRMPSNFPETAPGKYDSPVAAAIDSPAFAAQKAEMMKQFSSEAELKAFLADVDKVTTALRDQIWNLSGGGAVASSPAKATKTARGGKAEKGAASVAGAAGGR